MGCWNKQGVIDVKKLLSNFLEPFSGDTSGIFSLLSLKSNMKLHLKVVGGLVDELGEGIDKEVFPPDFEGQNVVVRPELGHFLLEVFTLEFEVENFGDFLEDDFEAGVSQFRHFPHDEVDHLLVLLTTLHEYLLQRNVLLRPVELKVRLFLL